jgi:hypothetical protein
MAIDVTVFDGFVTPTKNYFPMPNEWIDISSEIDNLAELKVIQYVLRHTWGYHEFGITKAITVEEFMHGRKRSDGSRIDRGTGLKSDRSVKDGIRDALKHGYLICEVDKTDLARIKKSYALKMSLPDSGGCNLPPDTGQVDTTPPNSENRQVVSTPLTGSIYPSGGQNLPLYKVESTPRSEKDTKETHWRNTPGETHDDVSASAPTPAPSASLSQDEDIPEDDIPTEPHIPSVKKGQNDRYDASTRIHSRNPDVPGMDAQEHPPRVTQTQQEIDITSHPPAQPTELLSVPAIPPQAMVEQAALGLLSAAHLVSDKVPSDTQSQLPTSYPQAVQATLTAPVARESAREEPDHYERDASMKSGIKQGEKRVESADHTPPLPGAKTGVSVASQEEVTQDLHKTNGRRKPATPKDETLKARTEAVFSHMEKIVGKLAGDPEYCFTRSAIATKHIHELLNGHLNGKSVTQESLELVLTTAWNTPKDPKTGFFWQENMTVKSMCNNYDQLLLKARVKANGKPKPASGQAPPINYGRAIFQTNQQPSQEVVQ